MLHNRLIGAHHSTTPMRGTYMQLLEHDFTLDIYDTCGEGNCRTSFPTTRRHKKFTRARRGSLCLREHAAVKAAWRSASGSPNSRLRLKQTNHIYVVVVFHKGHMGWRRRAGGRAGGLYVYMLSCLMPRRHNEGHVRACVPGKRVETFVTFHLLVRTYSYRHGEQAHPTKDVHSLHNIFVYLFPLHTN